MITAEENDDPITLAEACRLFPRAKLSIYTLRAEADRGRLEIFRIGKRDYTTLRDMQEMFRRCRNEDYRRDFTSIRSEKNGLSEMDRATSARAAIEKITDRLKKR